MRIYTPVGVRSVREVTGLSGASGPLLLDALGGGEVAPLPVSSR